MPTQVDMDVFSSQIRIVYAHSVVITNIIVVNDNFHSLSWEVMDDADHFFCSEPFPHDDVIAHVDLEWIFALKDALPGVDVTAIPGPNCYFLFSHLSWSIINIPHLKIHLI